MAYDCGDPSCPIRSEAGKNFEGVIAYAMETLRTVFDLTASVRNVKFSRTGSLIDSSASGLRVAGLTRFLAIQSQLEGQPYNQDLLEEGWSTLETALPHFDDSEKLLFRTSIRPTEPTLAEMAFCRVVDGWKVYLERTSGEKYGRHRDFFQPEVRAFDAAINEARNLFVHSEGMIGVNPIKKKPYKELFAEHAKSLAGSGTSILDLCAHVAGLSEGDRLLLGMRETLSYLHAICERLTAVERWLAAKPPGEAEVTA